MVVHGYRAFRQGIVIEIRDGLMPSAAHRKPENRKAARGGNQGRPEAGPQGAGNAQGADDAQPNVTATHSQHRARWHGGCYLVSL